MQKRKRQSGSMRLELISITKVERTNNIHSVIIILLTITCDYCKQELWITELVKIPYLFKLLINLYLISIVFYQLKVAPVSRDQTNL